MLWNKSVSGIFEIYNISPLGDLQCNAHKNADTLLMIDSLWLTLCSYFASALGFDALLIQLHDTWSFLWLFAIFFPRIEETGNLYFYPKFTFIKLPTIYAWFAVFSFKMVRKRIFSPRTPAKVRSNLKLEYIKIHIKCYKCLTKANIH